MAVVDDMIVEFVNQFNYYNSSKMQVSSTNYIATFNESGFVEVLDYNDSDFYAFVDITYGVLQPTITVVYDGERISSTFNAREESFIGPECEFITLKLNNLTKALL